MKKKLLSLLLIGIFVFGCVGCTEEKEKNNSNGGGTEKTAVKKKTLGDKIEFDGLELTFASDYTFTTLDNEFSDKNGSTVIKIGVNVKNISSEKNSLNMFFYDLFGSKGTELESVTAYFDDTVDFAGDLKPGASYDTYFYILYDGDGDYSIDFDNYTEQETVEFSIKK